MIEITKKNRQFWCTPTATPLHFTALEKNIPSSEVIQVTVIFPQPTSLIFSEEVWRGGMENGYVNDYIPPFERSPPQLRLPPLVFVVSLWGGKSLKLLHEMEGNTSKNLVMLFICEAHQAT